MAAGGSGKALPEANKNHARKMYHAALPFRPGIGSEMGKDARIPSIARQPAVTNRAILGARKFIKFSRVCDFSLSDSGKSFLRDRLT